MKHIINFLGQVDESRIAHLSSAISGAMAADASELEIHISSFGGNLYAGIAAYNIIRSLPIPVHAHNIGNIDNMSLLMYLAASTRTTCLYSRFYVGGLNLAFNQAQYIPHQQVMEAIESYDLDIKTCAQIFIERTRCSKVLVDVFEMLQNKPRVLDYAAAYEYGITTSETLNGSWDSRMIDVPSERWWHV